MADHPSARDTVAKENSRPKPAGGSTEFSRRSGLRSAIDDLAELGLRASA